MVLSMFMYVMNISVYLSKYVWYYVCLKFVHECLKYVMNV